MWKRMFVLSVCWAAMAALCAYDERGLCPNQVEARGARKAVDVVRVTPPPSGRAGPCWTSDDETRWHATGRCTNPARHPERWKAGRRYTAAKCRRRQQCKAERGFSASDRRQPRIDQSGVVRGQMSQVRPTSRRSVASGQVCQARTDRPNIAARPAGGLPRLSSTIFWVAAVVPRRAAEDLNRQGRSAERRQGRTQDWQRGSAQDRQGRTQDSARGICRRSAIVARTLRTSTLATSTSAIRLNTPRTRKLGWITSMRPATRFASMPEIDTRARTTMGLTVKERSADIPTTTAGTIAAHTTVGIR